MRSAAGLCVWDFFSLSPEATHQFTWLFGDRGIPASYRHMGGFGSHTFQWVNGSGEAFWVKYHFKSDQGIRCLTAEEAAHIAGQDPDRHQRDLLGAIDRGEHPSWTVKMQIMPVGEAPGYRFNPFDLTKVWSYRDYPQVLSSAEVTVPSAGRALLPCSHGGSGGAGCSGSRETGARLSRAAPARPLRLAGPRGLRLPG